MNDIKLTELIDVKILQRMLDAFSEFTGMAAIAADEKGVPVTRGSGFTELCMNLVRKCETGSCRCEECDRMGAIRTYESGTPVVYSCHVGLTDYAAPIMIEDEMIGSIIGGQVRTKPLSEAQERAAARALGIDEEIYFDASKKINLVEEVQVQKAAKFLTELAALLSGMAYKNYTALQNSLKLEKIARSQTNYMVDMYTGMEGTVGMWIEGAEHSLEQDSHEAMKKSLKMLVKNGRKILEAVGNTVEYAKMTDGELALSETMYNLREMVNDVVQRHHSLLEKKGNRVIIHISEEMSLNLFGDTGRLKQLAATLIKFSNNLTQDGVIEINACTKKVDYADMLIMEVKDNGRGVPEENITGLNRYMRHENIYLSGCTEEEEKELFILRMLVGQLSGRLSFASASGGGSIARVTIPQLEMR